MKKLYLIGGTMGVGKTTVCRILKQKMANAVFLDGDWCWDADPFQVNEETKNMVMDNICFLLNNFLHCSVYDHIIFCWVMHEQEIIDRLLAGLDQRNCQVKVISLLCSKKALTHRLEKDVNLGIRTQDIIKRSTDRIALYDKLSTIKIDTSNMNPQQVAEVILNMETEG